MTAFYEGLTGFEKIYAACAVFGGCLFLLRTLLMFLGHHGDVSGDMSGGVDVHDVAGHGDADASFKVLSLQGLTAFFMMFGLVGLALSRQSPAGEIGSLIGGVAAGVATVWLIGRIFIGMKNLQSDGTLRVANAVGQEGTVYLPIAPGRTGQVQMTVQGQLRVFDASAEGDQSFQTGDRVRVTRVTGASTLVVQKAQ